MTVAVLNDAAARRLDHPPAAGRFVTGSVICDREPYRQHRRRGCSARRRLNQRRIDGAISVSWNALTAVNGSHALTALARDTAGNQTTSAAVTVTVSNDTTPPVISAVAAASITASGATISWTTDEVSDSQVDFGLTAAYGSATSVLNATLVTAHTVSE